MRNNPRTESKTEFLVDAEYELDTGDDSARITVLIKHDYYSSDNDHGRSLLESFLNSLIADQIPIDSVILIDSGVKLTNNGILSDLIKTCSAGTLYLCSESLEHYDITPSVRCTCLSSSEIFNMLSWMYLEGDHLITIE